MHRTLNEPEESLQIDFPFSIKMTTQYDIVYKVLCIIYTHNVFRTQNKFRLESFKYKELICLAKVQSQINYSIYY